MESIRVVRGLRAWNREFREQRVQRAPSQRGLGSAVSNLLSSEDQPLLSDSTGALRALNGIKTQRSLKMHFILRLLPGLCFGYVQCLTRRLQNNPDSTLASHLDDQMLLQDATRVMMLSVCAARFHQSPQHADLLEQIYADLPTHDIQAPNLKDRKVEVLGSLLDALNTQILQIHIDAVSRHGPHHSLMVVARERRYEFFDSATGKGLYVFEDRETWKRCVLERMRRLSTRCEWALCFYGL